MCVAVSDFDQQKTIGTKQEKTWEPFTAVQVFVYRLVAVDTSKLTVDLGKNTRLLSTINLISSKGLQTTVQYIESIISNYIE